MEELEFVIRTVGERTEEVCIELVNQQKEDSEILHVLRENTHVKAVDSTIKIGLRCKAKWFVAIDADMLLTNDGLTKIRSEIRSCSSDVAILHPAVVDKLYRMKRWGLTVYRQSILSELYDEFLEIRKKQHLKIEGAAIKALSVKDNRKVVFLRYEVAIHDFYQYYSDLYRKAYLNALRNPGYNRKSAKCWKKLSTSDHDYLVMLKAIQDALGENRELTNSATDFEQDELDSIIQGLGLKEKSPLSWDDYVDQCNVSPMNKEIKKLDNDRMFNDYFDDSSLRSRIRSFLYRLRESK